MKKSLCSIVFLVLAFSINSFGQSFFQIVAGNWEGTLEYLDYSSNKRVKLKTYLTITPSPDGNSAEFSTVYDDFGKILKSRETVSVDLTEKKYSAGKNQYEIASAENGKIILLGTGQDGEKIEPIRQTISFDNNSLDFLKETRTPWQFRNQLSLKRISENILAKRILSPAQLKEDFSIFKQSLTKIHPGIYRYQTSESLEKLFGELESKLQNPLPEAEFFVLLAQFTNKLGCGHTYLNPYNQDGITRERIFNGKNYLPLYFRIVDGKMIITENASAEKISRGSEITKINGVSVDKIIEKFLTVTKADGRKNLAHRLSDIELRRSEAERYALFDMYFPLFFPLENEKFEIEIIDFATKKRANLQIATMTKEDRSAEMAKRYGKSPTYDDGWKFEIRENSTAYLKIDNSITWRLKTIKFKEFLADAFAKIRARNIKNLIIDLRGNGGGDMNLGYELSKYLADRELPIYGESRRLVRNVSAQTELSPYLQTYSDWLKNSLKNGFSENIYKKTENGFFEILPNENVTVYPKITPYENNFRGNTFIIADSAAASATFQFLNYVKENKLAVIVGQTSGGNKQGINGGNYFFLNLPNSKAEIDIPVYFQAALTRQKDESVVPDIRVRRYKDDIGTEIDREMLTINKLTEKN